MVTQFFFCIIMRLSSVIFTPRPCHGIDLANETGLVICTSWPCKIEQKESSQNVESFLRRLGGASNGVQPSETYSVLLLKVPDGACSHGYSATRCKLQLFETESYRGGWYRGNDLNVCSRGACFEYWPGYLMS
jgi:hypothetical protein